MKSQGRRKLLKPLYTELVKSPEGKARAKAIYEKGEPLYHTMVRNTVTEILDPKPAPKG